MIHRSSSTSLLISSRCTCACVCVCVCVGISCNIVTVVSLHFLSCNMVFMIPLQKKKVLYDLLNAFALRFFWAFFLQMYRHNSPCSWYIFLFHRGEKQQQQQGYYKEKSGGDGTRVFFIGLWGAMFRDAMETRTWYPYSGRRWRLSWVNRSRMRCLRIAW